ncbi:MAG: hypothetical protein L3J31_01300 [Bacteroidales bacterium]|nr:hypothetical protein [Bacteroidales bacterium]MCF6341426.1 hypothetical protein [Bacteroidales bacterium]
MLIISYLLIRQNCIKSQQRAILLEQRLLRSQMNPPMISIAIIDDEPKARETIHCKHPCFKPA